MTDDVYTVNVTQLVSLNVFLFRVFLFFLLVIWKPEALFIAKYTHSWLSDRHKSGSSVGDKLVVRLSSFRNFRTGSSRTGPGEWRCWAVPALPWLAVSLLARSSGVASNFYFYFFLGGCGGGGRTETWTDRSCTTCRPLSCVTSAGSWTHCLTSTGPDSVSQNQNG